MATVITAMVMKLSHFEHVSEVKLLKTGMRSKLEITNVECPVVATA